MAVFTLIFKIGQLSTIISGYFCKRIWWQELSKSPIMVTLYLLKRLYVPLFVWMWNKEIGKEISEIRFDAKQCQKRQNFDDVFERVSNVFGRDVISSHLLVPSQSNKFSSPHHPTKNTFLGNLSCLASSSKLGHFQTLFLYFCLFNTANLVQLMVNKLTRFKPCLNHF